MTETRTYTPVPQATRAWKGTILLVGLTVLLMLASGCYTMVATGRSLTDRGATDRWAEYGPEENYPDETAAWDKTDRYGGAVYEPKRLTGYDATYPETQLGLMSDLEAEGQGGVGVRFREYYLDEDDELGYLVQDVPTQTYVAAYRRPWVRRVYANWYYDWAYGWYPRPFHYGPVWAVGWNWHGFYLGWSSGYYWYDPFYWDSYYCDPFWGHGYSAAYAGWYGPWHGWYDPWYRPWWYWEPWYQNYWHWHMVNYAYDPWYPYYGHHGTTVVAVRDYARRPDDRRRGLSDEDQRRARGTLAGGTPGSGDGTAPDVKTRRTARGTTGEPDRTARGTLPGTVRTVRNPTGSGGNTGAPTVKTPRTTTSRPPTTTRPPPRTTARPPKTSTVKPPAEEGTARPERSADPGRPYLLPRPTTPTPEYGMVNAGSRITSRTPSGKTANPAPTAPSTRVQVGRPGDYTPRTGGSTSIGQRIGALIGGSGSGSSASSGSSRSRLESIARGLGAVARVIDSGSSSRSRASARGSSGSSSGPGTSSARPSSGGSVSRPSVGSSRPTSGSSGGGSARPGSSSGSRPPPRGKGKG